MGPLWHRARLVNPRAILLVALIVGVCPPPDVSAAVGEIGVKELATASDLIVLAKVSKVEDGPKQLRGVRPDMPPLKVEVAQVIESWKGNPVREVRYVASPTWTCDTSTSVEGERVVLFLRSGKGLTLTSIAHSGRGRMPVREAMTKTYATLPDRVIVPKETPTISENKTTRLVLPASRPGESGFVMELPYSVVSIELGVLRELVRSARP
jgi:hypothetical protein